MREDIQYRLGYRIGRLRGRIWPFNWLARRELALLQDALLEISRLRVADLSCKCGTPRNHPLRAWRISRGMKQGDLAEKLGIGTSQVSQIEGGLKGCSLEVAIRIKDLAGDAVPLECLVPAKEQAA